MIKLMKHTFAVIAVAGFAASGGRALAADRTAAEILKDLDGVPVPKIDRAKVGDPAYVREIRAALQKAVPKRLELIRELHKAAPDHEKLATLLPERWSYLPPSGPQGDETFKEVSDAVAHTKNEKLKVEGAFVKARIKLIQGREADAPTSRRG